MDTHGAAARARRRFLALFASVSQEDAVVYLRVVSAMAWLIMTFVMAINWWFEEPVGGIQTAVLAYAVLHTLGSLMLKAVEAITQALWIWNRRIERGY